MQNIPWQKIKALEEEIKQLKGLGETKDSKKASIKHLYGSLDGVRISEKEFKEAQKVLLSHSTFNLK